MEMDSFIKRPRERGKGSIGRRFKSRGNLKIGRKVPKNCGEGSKFRPAER